MQHPTFSAALAEQHRDALWRQAEQTRLMWGGGRHWRRHRPIAGRWWRPATRPARA